MKDKNFWITKKVGVCTFAIGRTFVVRALGSSHIVTLKVRAGLAFFIQGDRFSFRIPRLSQKFKRSVPIRIISPKWRTMSCHVTERMTYCEEHRHRANPNRHWLLNWFKRNWCGSIPSQYTNNKFRFISTSPCFFCEGRARYLTKVDEMNLLTRRRLRTGSRTLARHINAHTQSETSCSRHVHFDGDWRSGSNGTSSRQASSTVQHLFGLSKTQLCYIIHLTLWLLERDVC